MSAMINTMMKNETTKNQFVPDPPKQRQITNAGKKCLASLLLALICTAILSMNVSAASTVAKIGNKSYTSLQAAFNAVKNGQTVKLQKNMTIETGKKVTAKNNISFTLDLNGKTIKTGEYNGVKDGGYIVIEKGSMTVKNGTITGGWAGSWVGNGLYVKKEATLIVQSKAVCCGIENCGTVKLQKGTIDIICNESSIISVTGGSVSGELVAYGGNVTIENVKMTGRFCVQEATVLIKGGTFKSTDESVLYGSGKVTITGGTFSGKNSGTEEDDSVIEASGGTWKISGGTFQNPKGMVMSIRSDANVTITGGTFVGGKGKNAAIVCGGFIFNSGNSVLKVKGGIIRSAAGRAISIFPDEGKLNVKFILSGGTVESSAQAYPAIYVGMSKSKATGKLSVNNKYITSQNGTKVQYKN